MTTEKNYIDASAIEAVLAQNSGGLTIVAQKGFVKVTAAKGINLYVAKQNRVARVDLSGFRFDHPCVMAHSMGNFGAVEQELDFTRPEAEVLECLALILTHMKTLPERKIVRKPRAKKDGDAKGWTGLLFSDSSDASSPSSSDDRPEISATSNGHASSDDAPEISASA